MDRVKAFLVAFALLGAVPASADPVDNWRPLIAEASARFGIPADWIERVMRAESGGRTMFRGRPITSRAGAMGLMQLMPGTWAAMRAELGLGRDPHDPRDNILAGTAYLRAMYDRFGYPGLFAAYNAGPERYAQYLQARRSLPRETRAYLAQLGGRPVPSADQSTDTETRANVIFFALGDTSWAAPMPLRTTAASPLFVPLNDRNGER